MKRKISILTAFNDAGNLQSKKNKNIDLLLINGLIENAGSQKTEVKNQKSEVLLTTSFIL